MRVVLQNTTPMCMSGISTADQMSANSSEMLWRQKKAERSFGQKTGLIRYKTVNQTASCQYVCVCQSCVFQNTEMLEAWQFTIQQAGQLYRI